MTYSYTYSGAGRVTGKLMGWQMYNPNNPASPYPQYVSAQYTWDNQGKMASLTYGPEYTYQYDNVGRLNGMSIMLESGGIEYSEPMATATYGGNGASPNQMSGLSYNNSGVFFINEQISYNPLGQVVSEVATSIFGPTLL